jgi:azurin
MKLFKYLLASFLTLTILTACAGEEKKKEDTKKIKISTKKDTNINKDVNIVITGDDFMKFNTKEIKVKAGQKVKLTLRHIGKLDVNIMGHNIVILKKDVDPTEFAAKAATERDNEYIPKDSQEIIVHTKLIGGGETTVIEFDAPEVGTYEFLCSFPGHFAMMRGKFIVE